MNFSHNIRDNQWYGLITDDAGVDQYTFAQLDQTTTSATMRLNYTFTPNVSLQAYTSSRSCRRGRTATCASSRRHPRADDYDDRYARAQRLAR